jgi:galactose mutarotase-like enzyme
MSGFHPTYDCGEVLMGDDIGAVSLQPTTWHGLDAWTLESLCVRVVVIPTLGAKLVSLFDKRNGYEWLAGSGTRPIKPLDYGAAFEKQDMSGWDEMFPTISACAYPGPGPAHGVALPDHGEVWALPWMLESTADGRLRLSVAGRALPYRLTRTMAFAAADTLALHYELVNLGQEALPYIWAAHPQFACDDGAQIVLPPQVTEVCNVLPPAWGWGEPEALYGWPQATGVDGQPHRIDHAGGPELRRARKFYVLPDKRIGSAALVRQRTGDWLRMDWEPDAAPYFGLWVDEGALHHQAVAAPEPATGFYDSLALAYTKQQVRVLTGGQSTSWTLTVQLAAACDGKPAEG